MSVRLTPEDRARRQTAALYAIAHHQASKGYSPSFRDIGDACGISSVDSTLRLLRLMREAGLVDYVDRTARTLTITRLGVATLNEAMVTQA